MSGTAEISSDAAAALARVRALSLEFLEAQVR